jgi:hypothetical protein
LPHNSATSSAAFSTTQPTSTGIIFFGTNENGSLANQSSKRYSFASLGNGLTASESVSLFNLVQTMRQQLGGGYV